MINKRHSVTVSAPATSANVAVGFDILGFAVHGLGDAVTLTKNSDQEIRIVSLSGSKAIPDNIKKNTATVALQAMLDFLQIKQGFDLRIDKHIPLSSGLGGSAACAVAAVVALNQFLTSPLATEQLIPFALSGEEVACGARHGDNVVPSLLGGMTLIQSLEPVEIITLPLLPLYVVLIHPHIRVHTRDARAAIKPEISLALVTKQNARLGSFISALYEKNYERLAMACVDGMIEPMRAHLIPGFYEVQKAAYQHGALACSISGSGPTVFALVKTKKEAKIIADHMQRAFKHNGINSDALVTTIATQGAQVTHEQ